VPKVSVLIPTYNAVHFLPISIESALSQSYQDFEIIIIDDGSSDNTKEVAHSYIDKNPHKIRYFWQENKGLAMARNSGIAQSQGEYLALLDSDDKWLPCRLQEGVKILDADPSVGLVHGKVTCIDNNGNEVRTGKRNPKFLSGYIFDNIFLRKEDIACPTVLFRRSCCDDVGIFDAKLSRLGCEDRDLWLRIAQKYKIIFIDKVLSYYRKSSQSMSSNQKKMIEARLYVVDKYCPIDDQSKRRLRNKALARIFRNIGDEFLLKKDYTNARHEYQKAIGYDPLAFWPWVNWIKAVLYAK
jgi:glycosyltransferase involved in cell wall biosynthesis